MNVNVNELYEKHDIGATHLFTDNFRKTSLKRLLITLVRGKHVFLPPASAQINEGNGPFPKVYIHARGQKRHAENPSRQFCPGI